MKFYNRKHELTELDKLYRQTKDTARMAVITGRRRVGKTMLALKHAGSHKYLYLFVSRKSEHLLCMEYIEEIKKHFTLPVLRSFSKGGRSAGGLVLRSPRRGEGGRNNDIPLVIIGGLMLA